MQTHRTWKQARPRKQVSPGSSHFSISYLPTLSPTEIKRGVVFHLQIPIPWNSWKYPQTAAASKRPEGGVAPLRRCPPHAEKGVWPPEKVGPRGGVAPLRRWGPQPSEVQGETSVPLDLLLKGSGEMFHYSEILPARPIPGRLWTLANPDFTCRLAGDPKSSTLLLLQVRNGIISARDSFRGPRAARGPKSRAYQAGTAGRPKSHPCPHSAAQTPLGRPDGLSGTRDTGQPPSRLSHGRKASPHLRGGSFPRGTSLLGSPRVPPVFLSSDRCVRSFCHQGRNENSRTV